MADLWRISDTRRERKAAKILTERIWLATSLNRFVYISSTMLRRLITQKRERRVVCVCVCVCPKQKGCPFLQHAWFYQSRQKLSANAAQLQTRTWVMACLCHRSDLLVPQICQSSPSPSSPTSKMHSSHRKTSFTLVCPFRCCLCSFVSRLSWSVYPRNELSLSGFKKKA